MQHYRIHGGRPLAGTVAVAGAKNAALPIMASALLASEPVTLLGVPRLGDVDVLSSLLRQLGLAVARTAGGETELSCRDTRPIVANLRHVRQMRASFCVLGPLLARRGRAVVPLPGGCNLGDRPIDLHLAGLAALGADLSIRRGRVVARARRLVGARVFMGGPHGPTVTGTANVLAAATLARGVTTIVGAAREPEIVDLGRFLIALGADISGLGEDRIVVRGVAQLGGATYRVMPDRIEAATLLLGAAITGGEATLLGAPVSCMQSVLEALDAAGCRIDVAESRIALVAPARPRAVRLVARPYPGLPTDVQPQWTALATVADGRSTIRDAVFPDRFCHLAELRRLGAQVRRRGALAVVDGVSLLAGAQLTAADLRTGAALVLAALAARGRSSVYGLTHLDRGYENLESKLSLLGADIHRATAAPAARVPLLACPAGP